jgi:O-antigen/teichoic acid export membrane protein
MQIGRKDIAWNFVGTIMRVASGVILLPIVLIKLSREDVGLWNIYIQLGGLALLLDFGFLNSFGRNITYIFSGVKELKPEGYISVDGSDKSISYSLLRSVINAMRRYYGIIALVFLSIFLLASPFYLKRILIDYNGDESIIWVSWFIYGFLVAYQLYTYYYSSLLIGRGMVKKQQQITVFGQSCRILSSLIFLYLGFGIISLVIGQLVSDVVNRILSYNAFYDKDLKQNLKDAVLIPVGNVMKIMSPNAIRIGITTLGWFLTSKIIILVAPLLSITLPTVGSYGTTMQMINLIMSLSTLWFATFYPKMTLYRVNNQKDDLKRVYIKSQLAMLAVFIVCGTGLVLFGPILLKLVGSKTQLLPEIMIFVMLIFALLESNYGIANSFILSGNEVPYMKSSIITGVLSATLLLSLLKFTTLSTWAMILAPGIAATMYINWKWPLVAARKLTLYPTDYWSVTVLTIKELMKIKIF